MNINIPESDKKRIVIIGGGFGGLTLADSIAGKGFQVVLIDRNNYHQFQPLLYQVASSGLEPSSISFAFRKEFGKKRDLFFRLCEVKSILPEKKYIETTIGKLSYDYLVIAAGTTTNFFGNQGIARQAYPMKSIEEALMLRNALLLNLEKSLDCTDPEEQQRLVNVVIVGGGATGVEIAGALAEMKKYVVSKDYPDLAKTKMNIYLVEGSQKLLGVMSESSSAHALKFLREMGVNIILGTLVKGYENENVILSDGNTIPASTLIWVSGVTSEQFENIPKEAIGRGGRLIVDEFNRLKSYPDIFAIGDICLQAEESYPNGHPQVAPVAIQQGKLLAKNLQRQLKGQTMIPFHYKNQGTLATVGRNRAVADLHKIRLHGFPAWAVWMLVHLRSILGVKNKIMVLIDWVWNYVTYDRSMRFILFVRPKEKSQKE